MVDLQVLPHRRGNKEDQLWENERNSERILHLWWQSLQQQQLMIIWVGFPSQGEGDDNSWEDLALIEETGGVHNQEVCVFPQIIWDAEGNVYKE